MDGLLLIYMDNLACSCAESINICLHLSLCHFNSNLSQSNCVLSKKEACPETDLV